MNQLIFQTKNAIAKPFKKTMSLLLRDQERVDSFFYSLGIGGRWSKRNCVTIEDLEEESGRSQSEIIEQLDRQLKIDFYENVPLVRQVVMESVNKESNLILERGYAISLNQVENSNVILTSNLRTLLGKGRKLAGLPVGLTSRKAYNNYLLRVETFKKFIEANRKNGEIWRNVLALCVLDAVVDGASDVYLGYPSRDSFQYIVKNRKYQGKIDERIFNKLSDLFKTELTNEEIFAAIFPIGNGSCHLSQMDSQKSVTIVIDHSILQAKDNVLELSDLEKTVKVDPAQRHILLIDDDERFVELLKRGISGRGYKVSVAVSANDALMYHLSSESSIDLVVTDLYMPKMNGIELIEAIKSRRPTLPIIVLTTEKTPKSHIKVIEVGGNVVMNKEDDPQILLAWIKRLLKCE